MRDLTDLAHRHGMYVQMDGARLAKDVYKRQIPDTAKEKPLKGEVIAVGNGTKDEEMVLKGAGLFPPGFRS